MNEETVQVTVENTGSVALVYNGEVFPAGEETTIEVSERQAARLASVHPSLKVSEEGSTDDEVGSKASGSTESGSTDDTPEDTSESQEPETKSGSKKTGKTNTKEKS